MSWVAFNSATPKSCTGLQWSSVCLFVEEKKAIMYNKGGLFNYQFQQLQNINARFSILDFHFLAYKFLLFIIYELNSVRHCFSLLLTRSLWLHRTSSSLFFSSITIQVSSCKTKSKTSIWRLMKLRAECTKITYTKQSQAELEVQNFLFESSSVALMRGGVYSCDQSGQLGKQLKRRITHFGSQETGTWNLFSEFVLHFSVWQLLDGSKIKNYRDHCFFLFISLLLAFNNYLDGRYCHVTGKWAST